MNIIFHRYNSICEPDFLEAFETLGLEVIQDNAEMTRKNIPMKELVGTLGELILIHRPTFVFSINFFPFISMVCEKLGAIYVCVTVDNPVNELYSAEIRNSCNRVFLFDYKQYEEVHAVNPNCIFHMPLGVNVGRLDELLGTLTRENLPRYAYDVSFVGSLYTEKNPYGEIRGKLAPRTRGYCDGLIAAQRLLPGQGILEECAGAGLVKELRETKLHFFEDLGNVEYIRDMDSYVAVNEILSPAVSSGERVDTLNGLAKKLPDVGVHLFTRSDTKVLTGVHCHPGVTSLVEMPRVFRESKINLNMTIRSIQMGLSQRIWDVLGSGGFLLTNYQAELPEYFEIGKHLAAYENEAELAEVIAYYLSHEEERMEICMQGYELVKMRDTVVQRVIEMLRIITQASE